MSKQAGGFIIVGGGLAGASAVEGIRELNQDTPILMLGGERDLPYDRPPLSKKLWFGKEKTEEIFVHDRNYYRERGVELKLGNSALGIDPRRKEVRDDQGRVYPYEKLLIATGGIPRRLPLPGGDLDGIRYFRTLDDFRDLRGATAPGKTRKSAVVIGGGFIGSEIAAALNVNQIDVTMVFPESYLVHHVFPEALGQALTELYRKRGIRIFSGDAPVALEKSPEISGARFVTRTRAGRAIDSDLVIVGIGIAPATQLAENAGLSVSDGIEVSESLQTSDPDIFAAGDCCRFPYLALGKRTRVEHWDHAKNQGRQAGRNMAGAGERYEHLPFFYSDLFEFGYEAVGEVDSKLETSAVWETENQVGIIYYLKDRVIRGVMLCNTWGKVDWARGLIREAQRLSTLPDERVQELIREIPYWKQAGSSIVRELEFEGFPDAIGFVNRVADAAEEADHHPDIRISYNKVRLDLSTHSAGGLTSKDFELARRIEQLLTSPTRRLHAQ